MHGPAPQSPHAMNEPAQFVATLVNLHGPPLRESPIGAWATRIACETEEKAIAWNRDRTVGARRRLEQLGRCVFCGLTPVSDGETNDPWRLDSSRGDAPSAHRRPGDSLSGCTPAEPDSASPGTASIRSTGRRHKAGGRPRVRPADRSVSATRHRSPRKDASMQVGKDTP